MALPAEGPESTDVNCATVPALFTSEARAAVCPGDGTSITITRRTVLSVGHCTEIEKRKMTERKVLTEDGNQRDGGVIDTNSCCCSVAAFSSVVIDTISNVKFLTDDSGTCPDPTKYAVAEVLMPAA